MRTLQAAAAAACLLTAAIAGQSLAATDTSSREPSSERIEVGAVDFRDGAQVQAFYKRLQQASMFVCGVSSGVDSARRDTDRACAENALRQAVEATNRPLLTATYQQAGAPMLARGY